MTITSSGVLKLVRLRKSLLVWSPRMVSSAVMVRARELKNRKQTLSVRGGGGERGQHARRAGVSAMAQQGGVEWKRTIFRCLDLHHLLRAHADG